MTCEVCDRPASKYTSYGAMTCHSCRVFFARSSKDSTYQNFVCINEVKENQCEIVLASSKGCKSCRFQKCVQVGMKIKNKNKNGGSKTEAVAVVADHLRGSLMLTNKLTNEERAFIRNLVIKRHEFKLEQRAKIMMVEPKHFMARLQQTFCGKAMTLKSLKTFENFMVYGQLQAFSTGEFSMDGLTRKDRAKLFANNFLHAFEFSEAYRPEIERWEQLENPIKHVQNILREMNGRESKQLYHIRNQINQNGTLQPMPIT